NGWDMWADDNVKPRLPYGARIIRAKPRKRSKRLRAQEMLPHLDAGRVTMQSPTAENGVGLLRDQCLSFTGSDHEVNDMVDAMIYGLMTAQSGHQARLLNIGVH
ncbi:MAG TPA: hypothetical protein VKM54_24490, partial [Myxococcota bacterium]|nr:hypothetical protein [Myxococcota bacterium]